MTTPHEMRKISRSQVAKCFEVFRRRTRHATIALALLSALTGYAQNAWSYSAIEESNAEAWLSTTTAAATDVGPLRTPPTTAFFTPLDWLDAWIQSELKVSQGLYDLIHYMRQNTSPRSREDLLSVLPKYDRVELYGGWINEDGPSNCYNTRAEVLLRDSEPNEKVHFAPGNKCMVAKAKWKDPYSGTQFKLANAVQVDHLVPLKAAYLSGAHAWNKNRRAEIVLR